MDSTVTRPRALLARIVFSAFAGTSLWFASNAVLGDVGAAFALPAGAVADVTSAVQLGFISGTFVFAVFAITDRFPPARLFCVCALLGACANLGMLVPAGGYPGLLASRFATGFFLAGIYPVGMRIATDWYRRSLGHAIGALTGALVLGTAFPHLLRALGYALPWQHVIVAVSALAALGGASMLALVPEGPHARGGGRLVHAPVRAIFRSAEFRASATGYFGHMWELYTLWAFVPVMLAAHAERWPQADLDVALWSFLVIAVGSVGCAGGGLLSLRTGSSVVAFAQLATSALCCAAFPLMIQAPPAPFLAYLLLWGVVVVGDSPQFSTLNAQTAPPGAVGTALTLVVCIGFSVTVVSMQATAFIAHHLSLEAALFALLIGPVAGLVAMRPIVRFGANES